MLGTLFTCVREQMTGMTSLRGCGRIVSKTCLHRAHLLVGAYMQGRSGLLQGVFRTAQVRREQAAAEKSPHHHHAGTLHQFARART